MWLKNHDVMARMLCPLLGGLWHISNLNKIIYFMPPNILANYQLPYFVVHRQLGGQPQTACR